MRAAAVVLALLLALPASAEEERPIKALRGQIESALRDHDFARAASLVDAVVGDLDRPTAVCAALADTVLELFPHELGNPRAAQLAGRVLADDANRAALWSSVTRTRRRLLEDADVENGTFLLDRMRPIYSSTSPADVRALVRLDYDAAYLYLDAGRQNRALETLERIVAAHPGEHEARLKLAEVLEDRGRADDALAQYDAVIGSGDDPRDVLLAHKLKGRVLLDTKRDFEGARAAVAAGLGAATRLPVGTTREAWLRVFEDEAVNVDGTIGRWDDVHALEDRVGRLVLGAAGAWVLVLGGVVLLLRRLQRASPGQP